MSTFEPVEPIEPIETKLSKSESSGSRTLRRIHSFKNFQFELVRATTFADWDNEFVSAESLAKEGFFCLHKEDHVQCHFCRGAIGGWVEGKT